MTSWDDVISKATLDEPMTFTYQLGNEINHVTVIPRGLLLSRRVVDHGHCDLCGRLVQLGVVWQWQGCWAQLCATCFEHERGCSVCRHLTAAGCEIGKTDNVDRDWRKLDCEWFERWSVALWLFKCVLVGIANWSVTRVAAVRLRYFKANEPEFAEFLEWLHREKNAPYPATDEQVAACRRFWEMRKQTLEMREERKRWQTEHPRPLGASTPQPAVCPTTACSRGHGGGIPDTPRARIAARAMTVSGAN